MAIGSFNFSQTTPAGLGLDLPEGVYVTTIKEIEDREGNNGLNARFALQVDPGQGGTGVIFKTLRYPKDAEDKVLPFWLSLFMSAFNKTEEHIKQVDLSSVDIAQVLPGRKCHVRFKPDARTYTDNDGKEKTGYDVSVISPQAYQDGIAEAAAAGNAGMGSNPQAAVGGNAGAVMPSTQAGAAFQQAGGAGQPMPANGGGQAVAPGGGLDGLMNQMGGQSAAGSPQGGGGLPPGLG